MRRVGASAVSGADGRGPEVAALHPMITRVVRSRVGNHPAAEDLVQETLARVLGAAPRIEPGRLEAYAVTTARNVVASHWREQATHTRHQPRLLDLEEPPSPDEGILSAEDRTAVRAALGTLTADERDLVLAHEVDGVSTRQLATRFDSTPGAVAAQLHRLRARLRAEYLVAASRTEPPTERCRPVLAALAGRDTRRRREVGVDEHLDTCDFCQVVGGSLTIADERRVVVDVATDRDIVDARQAVRRLAAELGFDAADQTLISTAVSEVARNIVKFAERGRVTADPLPDEPGIRVVARDRGPGIPDVERAMRDGFTTYGGLGLGLPGARRLMHTFDVQTRAGQGTTITMTRLRKDPG